MICQRIPGTFPGPQFPSSDCLVFDGVRERQKKPGSILGQGGLSTNAYAGCTKERSALLGTKWAEDRHVRPLQGRWDQIARFPRASPGVTQVNLLRGWGTDWALLAVEECNRGGEQIFKSDVPRHVNLATLSLEAFYQCLTKPEFAD